MHLPLLFLLSFGISPPAGMELHQPQLAAAHGEVALTYGSGSTIWFASSADGGRSFSPAVKVADAGSLMLGRHRGPRVAILSDAIVITAHAGENHDLTAWRSTDGGRTWSRAGVLNDIPGCAREGLHALVADAQDHLFAAWLDLRGKGTRLYGAQSTDGGRTWSKNIEIYESPAGTICQCCAPSLAADPAGGVWAMWRNVVEGSRDLYAAHTSDGQKFGAAQKLGEGTWRLDACPMDGGALAIEGGRPVSAWRRESTIFLAEPGRPEKRLGEGKDVSMAVGAKGAYTAWSSARGLELQAPGAAGPKALASAGGYPNLVSLPDGAVLAAWEDQGKIRIERLP